MLKLSNMTITFFVAKEAKNVKISRPFLPSNLTIPDESPANSHPFLTQSKKCTGEIISSSDDLLKDKYQAKRGNSFVGSLFAAYSSENNVVIRPDDVWLALVSQFSFYINKHSETLREKFVSFQGKEKLQVDGVGSVHTVDYRPFCEKLCAKIAEKLKDPSFCEWIQPSFSTTTLEDKMIGSVMLMSSMKNYFDYKICLSCGLSNVTLLGEVEDWQTLREKASRFLEFNIKELNHIDNWCKKLFPVLDQFVRSAEGRPDVDFWNRICTHIGGGSGPSYMTGWLSLFCVFDEKGNFQAKTRCSRTKVATDFYYIDTSEIPTGYVCVPIEINDNGNTVQTIMVAGHMSHSCPDPKTIQPNLQWFLMRSD